MLSPDYATLDEGKRYLRIPGLYSGTLNAEEDVNDDIPLALAITAASRAIDHATNRQFGYLDIATAFDYTVEWSNKLHQAAIAIDDLMDLTDIVVERGGEEVTDYTFGPMNAIAKGRPYTRIVFDSFSAYPRFLSREEAAVTITAKWGWLTVPDAIKNATLLQTARFFKRRDAPFGVAGSVELGSEIRLLAKVDPDVAVMLQSYKRYWGAV